MRNTYIAMFLSFSLLLGGLFFTAPVSAEGLGANNQFVGFNIGLDLNDPRLRNSGNLGVYQNYLDQINNAAPPFEASVLINGGSKVTTSRDIILRLSMDVNPTNVQYKISTNDPRELDFLSYQWRDDMLGPINWQLPEEPGTHIVYVGLRHNIVEETVVAASITYDPNFSEVIIEEETVEVEEISENLIACTREYRPVCGHDGKTYSNSCVAKSEGMTVRHEGECAAKVLPKTEPKNLEEENQVFCTLEFNPVCGVDGKTYSNRCFAANQAKVDIKHDGECKKVEQQQEQPKDKKLQAILRAPKVKTNTLEVLNSLKEDGVTLKRDTKKEEGVRIKFADLRGDDAVTNFISYGFNQNTNNLGEGERAGALYSYLRVHKQLPQTDKEWEDVLKVSMGRFPSIQNEEAEINAKEVFKKIYLREANLENENDKAAIWMIAYGIRPVDRNLESEKFAINVFRNIFGQAPQSSSDWDTLRAIAYSGASR